MSSLPALDKIALELYEAAARTRKQGRGYLGMSEIGKPCDRALWYSFRGFTPLPIEGRMIMIFDLGDQVEARTIHWLTLAGYKIEGQQGSFSAHNDLFRGHCDGIIHGVTQKAHILEIKSANDAKFKTFKAKGVQKTYPTYYAQVQCYMGYSGLERALFVITNKNTSEVYTERVYFSKTDYERLHNRAKCIISANEPPEHRFIDGDFECNYCDFRVHCWNPTDAIQEAQVCGCCAWLEMSGLKPYCHKHKVDIQQWGSGCDDWGFLQC